MSKYVITCESTVDLTKELLKEKGIPYISYAFILDDQEYEDDFGHSYPYDKLYDDIRSGALPHTTQINIEKYKNFFEKYLKEGNDILHISLSSGFTSSYNSCMIAIKELKEKYNQEIYLIDSLNASSGSGLLTILINENKEKGMSLEDNYHWALENRYHIHSWFFSTDLTSLIRGGRISKTAGFFGGALKVCPLFYINDEGKVELSEKIRTKSKAMQMIMEKMINNATNNLDYNERAYIAHSACLDDAKELKEKILNTFKNIKEVEIYNIGSAIGTHTGPGTIGLFFIGEKKN